MTNENHEQMLIDTAAFLKKYTAGIFDSQRPVQEGVYYHFPEIVNLLCLPVPEISISQCSEKAGVIGVELVPLFSGFLDGSLDPSRIRNNAPEPIAEFLDDYQKIWIPNGDKSREIISRLAPELVIDLAVGGGSTAQGYLKNISRELGRGVQFLGVDKSEDQIARAKERKIPHSSLFVGELMENGDVSNLNGNSTRFSGIINRRGRRFVMGSGACGYLSDYMGEFAAKNRIEGFSILRCCYHEMPGRRFISEHGQSIPLNETIAEVVSDSDSEDRRDITILNRFIANLYRQAVSLDFAMEMQKKGYSAQLERNKDHFIVCGTINQ